MFLCDRLAGPSHRIGRRSSETVPDQMCEGSVGAEYAYRSLRKRRTGFSQAEQNTVFHAAPGGVSHVRHLMTREVRQQLYCHAFIDKDLHAWRSPLTMWSPIRCNSSSICSRSTVGKCSVNSSIE